MICHQLQLLTTPRLPRPLLPAIISQGQWHVPIELFVIVALTTVLSLGWCCSLCKRRCAKCYNYVNSVQPKCFCRWSIAKWTAFWRIFSALGFSGYLTFKFHLYVPLNHIFTSSHIVLSNGSILVTPVFAYVHSESIPNPYSWRRGPRGWFAQLHLALARALLLLRGLKDITGVHKSKLNHTRCFMRFLRITKRLTQAVMQHLTLTNGENRK